MKGKQGGAQRQHTNQPKLFHKYSELLAGFKPGFVMEMS
jgi:hypothetical protein